MSGRKPNYSIYDPITGEKYDQEVYIFVKEVLKAMSASEAKIYFKDSLLKQSGIKREELPNNCVRRDYNMFDK
jgi:hypothetical protein